MFAFSGFAGASTNSSVFIMWIFPNSHLISDAIPLRSLVDATEASFVLCVQNMCFMETSQMSMTTLPSSG